MTPVIGYLGRVDPSKVQFNADEVSHVFHVPLKDLLDPHRRKMTLLRESFQVPEWKVTVQGGEMRLWGLTAFMLHYILKDVFVRDNNKYS